MKSKFHVLFEKEKVSEMFHHFGAKDDIYRENGVTVSDFEDELLRTGYESISEADEDIRRIFKDDPSLTFAVLFENAKLVNVFKRDF